MTRKMSAAERREMILARLREGPILLSQVALITGSGRTAAQDDVAALEAAGLAARTARRTPNARRGVDVWHVPGESVERIDAAVGLARRSPRGFVYYGIMR